MRLGCIGIGSNAIRLLVASWKDGQLCDVRRERRGTRLFAGLKQSHDFQLVFLLLMVPCYLYILYFATRGHRAGQAGAARR